jgi:MoxR-like ATPase
MTDKRAMRPDEVAQALERRIRSVFIGQDAVLELLLASLAARSHVLLEGPPGTAKTLLASAIAAFVGLRFARVQLTPDLMPSDLLGTSVWLPQEGRFDFRPGPVFTDVLLADELNRAPPKTQAALLEAMQERQVTYDGVTRSLGERFWVIATQNPLEQEGTYPLPESQLDRFALKVAIDYPADGDERDILTAHRDGGEPGERLRKSEGPVLTPEALAGWQQAAVGVHVADTILDYVRALVRGTRTQPDLAWGAGPRAGIALLRVGQALALVRGRTYVIPDDIRDLVYPVLAHRVRLAPEAQIAGLGLRAVISRLVAAVPVPTVHTPGASAAGA